MTTTIPLTIRFQPSLHAWLTVEAARLEISVGELVRRITDGYREREMEREVRANRLWAMRNGSDEKREKWR